MAQGISLHIGVNRVDPQHYDGWSGPLVACEADAEDMQALADSRGFESSKLLTAEATRDAVIDGIRSAAARLGGGDIFFLTYSGHGGRVPDMNGDEDDLKDETWCLYDGQLIDDELWELWHDFAEGARILVLSDSCHSGTAVRAPVSTREMEELRSAAAEVGASPGGNGFRYRYMPREAALATYRKNRGFYDGLARKLPDEPSEVKASVRLISGCQDEQYSLDGDFNGLFTGKLKRVWNDGAFEGDYARFHHEILRRMPATQSPNHFQVGREDPSFDAQTPFSI